MSDNIELTEKDRRIMDEYHQAMLKDQQDEQDRNAAVMEQVRDIVGDAMHAEIVDYIQETGGYTHSYSLETAAKGEPQEDGYDFDPVYVDQTGNGGWSGDDFSGTVSIDLKNGQFLQFNYSC